MEFLKTATAMRKAKSNSTNRIKFTFLDFDENDISWNTLYDDAVQLASWFIRRDWTMTTTAIIGRTNKFCCTTFVSRK